MNYDLSVNVLSSQVVEKTGQKARQGSPETSFNSVIESKRPKPINIYEKNRCKQVEKEDECQANRLKEKDYESKADNADKKTENGKNGIQKNSKAQDDIKEQDAQIKGKKEKILNKLAEMLGIGINALKSILEVSSTEIQGLEIDSAEVLINKLEGLIDSNILNKKQIIEEVEILLKELKIELIPEVQQSEVRENSNNIKEETEGINSDGRVQEKAGANDTSQNTKAVQTVIKSSEENMQSASRQNNIKPDNKKDGSIKIAEEVNKQEGIRSQNTEDEKPKKIQDDGEKNSGFTDEEKKSEDWKDKIKVITVNTEKENNFKITENNMPQISADINEVKGIRADIRTHNTLPYNRDEILKQVVDKAAVLISEDKAEMVINLKPDNLGKLMLKIVTERGIVTAQMVTENQQVRQIIESNLNILRDALEKQGIAVQEFSVSVGQDSWNRGFNQKYERNFSKRPANIQNTLGMAVGGFAYQGREEVINNYLWPESTINFTA